MWKWLKDRIKVPTKQDPRTYYEKKPFGKGMLDFPLGSIFLFSRLRQDFLGWIIRWVTNAEVCHAGVYVGDGFIVEATPDGVKKNGLTTHLNDNDMMWVYDFKNALPEQRIKIVEAATRRIDMPYDFADLVGFLLGHHHDTQGKTICSELVVRCARDAKLECSDKPADATAPGDIQDFASAHPNQLYLYDTQNVKS